MDTQNEQPRTYKQKLHNSWKKMGSIHRKNKEYENDIDHLISYGEIVVS